MDSDNLLKQHNELMERYNNVVDSYNTLLKWSVYSLGFAAGFIGGYLIAKVEINATPTP